MANEVARAQESSAAETPAQVRLTKKQNLLQGFKYLLFATSAGIIQAASFTLMNEMIRWDYWPSYLIALTLSVVYNFTVNRKFTFKSAKNVP
ncbi:MAG: GtrA family protein, partial [Sulfurospirillaceae bacterium]|nr:GtrA family protein [Sulfurospirillaceae bacterium]